MYVAILKKHQTIYKSLTNVLFWQWKTQCQLQLLCKTFRANRGLGLKVLCNVFDGVFWVTRTLGPAIEVKAPRSEVPI